MRRYCTEKFIKYCLTFEDGKERVARNVGSKLLTTTAV